MCIRDSVWFNQYIVGFEFFYKTSFGGPVIVECSSGAHKGADTQNIRQDTFVLADDEWIQEVTGNAGAIIDGIGFKTNKGKSMRWGGVGGAPFQWIAPNGYCFQVFNYSVNGHLHQLSATPDPLSTIYGANPIPGQPTVSPWGVPPMQPTPPQVPAPNFAPPTPMAPPQPVPTAAPIPPNYGAPPPSYGVPPNYGAPPPNLGAPPPVYGAPPQANYGQPPVPYGFPPINNPSPTTTFVTPNAIVTVVSNSLADMNISGTPKNKPTNPYLSRELKSGVKRSVIAGNVNHDTKFFDDWQNLLHKEFFDPEPSAVTVWYDDNFIIGIQFTYKSLDLSLIHI
eukprot:TRINITY_DN11445_c0_g1_i5.p1 TRINITY_DN11445_c0_g1~~TRINITY_DN11445_c0_g1_i5.p1  ORF type:complete len:358 (-),score=85.80 TRINITY_DN11445_c0_g1_i5:61-1074(-)